MFQDNMFENHNMVRDDDQDSKSETDIMEAPAGNDQDLVEQPGRRKRYHRHSIEQLQEMEALFKEHPHPTNNQRIELASRLSLEPLQIKFWFQNKRTQAKAQQERSENANLRILNEQLRAEHKRLMEAVTNATCLNCGRQAAIGEMSFDKQKLLIENARLREEIDRIPGITSMCFGKEKVTYPDVSSHGPSHSLELSVANFNRKQRMVREMLGAIDLPRPMVGPTEIEKPIIVELAFAAMDEIKKAQVGGPLWYLTSENPSHETLRLKTEASRESKVLKMDQEALVKILMDVNEWSNAFCGIVSRAMTLEVLSTGVDGSYDGAMQMMTAEYQIPTPLVPTRKAYFVRYCKQQDDGMWVVVDVSLDNLRSSISRCRRRPSGCLIQDMLKGFSKVTWVEHLEVDDGAVHDVYKVLVNSGLAFGAKRWVATLERQCERLASTMASNIPAEDVGVILTPEGRKGLLKLSQKMVLSFFSRVGASTNNTWTTLSGCGSDDVRVMTLNSMDDPGKPSGIVLNAATSFRLPVPPKKVFEFLRNESRRSKWDILSNCGEVREMAHIANGRDPGNCVSLLRVVSTNEIKSDMLILQESSNDSMGSYVIYAPVDIASMSDVLTRGDPDYVVLRPYGFAILPDGLAQYDQAGVLAVGSGGSLITVSFQILVDSVPTAKISLGSEATINDLIKSTAEKIKNAVSSTINEEYYGQFKCVVNKWK